MKLRTHASLLCLCLVACSDDGASPKDTSSGTDATATSEVAPDVTTDATVEPDGTSATDATSTTDATSATDVVPDIDIDEWPWPTETITVPADPSWKSDIEFPSDPFLAYPTIADPPQPRWVKFVVLTGDPTRVFFQDSMALKFHYDFAKDHLPPFEGLSPSQFDALTLAYGTGQKAILGAVLFAPERIFNGADQRREVGIQIVGRDAYPFIVSQTVLALVKAHVTTGDGKPEPDFFYLPTFEQTPAATADAARFEAAGFPVSSLDRWQYGNSCYAEGWALGRLVKVAAADIDEAYADGTLRFDDILLTDGVPAEVPFVAGIISSVAATPSSHVAILADTFDVPFVYVGDATQLAAVDALVGHTVALTAASYFGAQALGSCRVDVRDVVGLEPADRDAILALKAPAPLDFPAKETLGDIAVATDALTGKDIANVGGKAAHFGILRRTIPKASPSPAIALTFDLWDRVIGPLRTQIDQTLAEHHWPPNVAALEADLETVRDLVKDLSLPQDVRDDVVAALREAGFDDHVNIRFRSSTNVEDQASFTGAGLYDSYSGCLADDLDADALGPSACDPSEVDERGVFRALKKVYASFWNNNAYLERLRHGVDEDHVGMAVLVHPSYPDATELANGVATFYGGGDQSVSMQIVAQLGAVSVTNPELVDGVAPQPEVMAGNIYEFGEYYDVRQHSSLVPIGGYVMAYDADYVALGHLLAAVGDAWGKEVTDDAPYILDFEFKKVVAMGDEPEHLEVKQVRPLPMASGAKKQTAFLLPEAQRELCTFQGEYGNVHGTHRLKVRVLLDHVVGFAGEATLAASLYPHFTMTRASVEFDGDPTTFTGYTHEAPVYDEYGYPSPAIDRWTRGAGAARETWELGTTAQWRVATTEAPLLVQDDLAVMLGVGYATPRVEPDQFPDGTTDYDGVHLGTCPEDVVLTPAHGHQNRRISAKGVSADVNFYWPPAPTGVTAGYTAPLAKWDVTTITGLVSVPITLRGYWSQTYKPGHHNFDERFVFEPRLEEDIDPGIVAELEALNIAAIVVRVGSDTVEVLGLDGKIRELGN